MRRTSSRRRNRRSQSSRCARTAPPPAASPRCPGARLCGPSRRNTIPASTLPPSSRTPPPSSRSHIHPLPISPPLPHALAGQPGVGGALRLHLRRGGRPHLPDTAGSGDEPPHPLRPARGHHEAPEHGGTRAALHALHRHLATRRTRGCAAAAGPAPPLPPPSHFPPRTPFSPPPPFQNKPSPLTDLSPPPLLSGAPDQLQEVGRALRQRALDRAAPGRARDRHALPGVLKESTIPISPVPASPKARQQQRRRPQRPRCKGWAA